ncbi:MAG TPA: Calx-beta domain-containing protein, partial [Actinomycetota bacterium]|nr:Calx-beta domain-containing protein [Actinomycetota bacterium]
MITRRLDACLLTIAVVAHLALVAAPAGALAAPKLRISNATVTEGDAGTKTATFVVKLSRRFSKKVRVKYATVNGTAKAPADLTAKTGNLVFKPRQISKKITIAVKGDVLDEANETFKVKLKRPTRARIADATGVGTIVDNDVLPALSISDANSVDEGDTGSTPMNFDVSLSAPSGRTVKVDYAASGISADATDFTATSGTLTLAAGETFKAVAVPITGDTEDELDEGVLVTLSEPFNATLDDVSNSGAIVDDDGPQITVTDVEVLEEDGTHTATLDVELSDPSIQVVTVEWQIVEAAGQPALETATAGVDFTASGADLLTFPAGDTSESIAVEISGDIQDEADEKFAVMLSGAVNADAASETLITIDDDDGPTLAVNDAPVVGEGAGNMTFTVTLSAP